MHTLILAKRSDVSAAQSLNRWILRPIIHSVRIADGVLEPDERIRTERRLLRLFNDCGCAAAAISLVSAILVGAFFLPISSLAWWKIGLAMLAAIGSSFLVKLFALLVSHRRLAAKLDALTYALPQEVE